MPRDVQNKTFRDQPVSAAAEIRSEILKAFTAGRSKALSPARRPDDPKGGRRSARSLEDSLQVGDEAFEAGSDTAERAGDDIVDKLFKKRQKELKIQQRHESGDDRQVRVDRGVKKLQASLAKLTKKNKPV